jgi:hypothetical protein
MCQDCVVLQPATLASNLSRQREIDRLPLKRGELAAGTDVELAVDQLVGPIYYRVLVTGEPVDSKFTNSLVALYFRSQNR